MPLGCAATHVGIGARGGVRPRFWLPHSSHDYTRVLDSTSTASCRVSGETKLDQCRRYLEDIRTWRDELMIYRDNKRVWTGPIEHWLLDDEGLSIQAKDRSLWLWVRLIHEDHSYAGVDLARIAEAFIIDAMAPDPSPNLRLDFSNTGIREDRSVLASQHAVCGSQLTEITNTGLDWTVLVDTMHAGASVGGSPLRLMADHLASIEIADDGRDAATHVVMVGSGVGPAGDHHAAVAQSTRSKRDTYGLIERVFTQPEITCDPGIAACANSRLDLIEPRLMSARPTALDAKAPFDFDDLVPGRLVLPTLSWQPAPLQRMRLQQVSVSGGPESDTVSVTLEPEGTEL